MPSFLAYPHLEEVIGIEFCSTRSNIGIKACNTLYEVLDNANKNDLRVDWKVKNDFIASETNDGDENETKIIKSAHIEEIQMLKDNKSYFSRNLSYMNGNMFDHKYEKLYIVWQIL